MKNLFLLLLIFTYARSTAQNSCSTNVLPCSFDGDGINGPVIFTPNSTVNGSVQIFTRLYSTLDDCVSSAANIQFNTFSNITSLDCPTASTAQVRDKPMVEFDNTIT